MVKIMASGTKIVMDTQAAMTWIRCGIPQQSESGGKGSATADERGMEPPLTSTS